MSQDLSPAATTKEPPTEIQRLQQQASEYLAGWQRAKADYLNLKKQSEREKDEVIKFAHAALVLELLPIYDNLKRALRHIPPSEQDRDWVKGVRHIRQQFQRFFRDLEIVEIKTLGVPFDPNQHHAVAKEKRLGVAPGTILEEVKTGFMVGDKVIAPAQVRVAE